MSARNVAATFSLVFERVTDARIRTFLPLDDRGELRPNRETRALARLCSHRRNARDMAGAEASHKLSPSRRVTSTDTPIGKWNETSTSR